MYFVSSNEIQKYSAANSECVLVGKIKIIDPKEQIFEIEVIESFDGSDIQGNSYIGKGWKYCSPFVEHEGFWIIYGYTEDGYLRPNICGISRSFDFLSATFDNSSSQNFPSSANKDIRNTFLTALYMELKALREKRQNLIRKNTNL